MTFAEFERLLTWGAQRFGDANSANHPRSDDETLLPPGQKAGSYRRPRGPLTTLTTALKPLTAPSGANPLAPEQNDW